MTPNKHSLAAEQRYAGREFTADIRIDALDQADAFKKCVRVVRQKMPASARGGSDDGRHERSTEWIKAKIIASCFVLHCRTRKNWSQAALAQRVGVSAAYIGQIESLASDVRPPMELLIKIAHTTGTPFKLTEPEPERPESRG